MQTLRKSVYVVVATLLTLNLSADDNGVTSHPEPDGMTSATQQQRKDTTKTSFQFLKEYSDNEVFRKFRFGGYGEMLYKHMDYGENRYTGALYGNKKDDRHAVSIPRFVIAGDYKFNKWWQLGAEIEFESGGTGVAVEKERKENGEIEIEYEKGGEVALEQFHITATVHTAFNVRVGHIIVPVGQLNAHHEPVNFFGTSRPEGEVSIIPTTWHETGAEVFGTFGKDFYTFDYEAQIVSGLTVDGFDKYSFISEARQGLFEEDVFNCPAYVGRIDYRGVPGLRVGGSVYYLNDAGRNSTDDNYYVKFKTSVLVLSADLEYKHKYLIARGNYTQGEIGNYDKLKASNIGYTSTAGYGKELYSGNTPVASKGLTYGGEVGVNLGQIITDVFGLKKPLKIIPFARYDYYNPFYDGTATALAEVAHRQEVSSWTVGINWYALPNLVLKVDAAIRHIGTQSVFKNNGGYNTENDISVGVAYAGWFAKK